MSTTDYQQPSEFHYISHSDERHDINPSAEQIVHIKFFIPVNNLMINHFNYSYMRLLGELRF